MKNVIIILIFCQVLTAQELSERGTNFKHEIKLNTFYLAYGALEIDYEYLFENSSIGLALTLPAGELFTENVFILISPYTRFYLGKKQARGFFLEGFAMYVQDNEDQDLVFGASLGSKFTFKKKFTIEVNFGLGGSPFKNGALSNYFLPIAPRIGINIGMRF